MFRIERSEGRIPQFSLYDDGAGSLCTLAPSRGGMATRLFITGEEVFFLDQESFLAVPKNVRGGNPVLFPTPGKLIDDSWARGEHAGTLKQHGFGRNEGWTVDARSNTGGASVTLRLRSNDTTRANYPWDFDTSFRYTLQGDTLRIDMNVANTGSATMPFGVGFHPYFLVPQSEKGETTISTAATRAFDNRTKEEITFGGFSLTDEEVDLHLHDHGSTECTLRRPGAEKSVIIRGSEEFTHWVVWTLQGRDFVCVEPWTCPSNAMNTGDRLFHLPPGESKALWLEYSFR
jgi:galactose mutarotase-like enzyme